MNFSQFPDPDDPSKALGITPENLEIFVKQNSAPFCLQYNTSFRNKVNQNLDNVSEFYQPFFYNLFLEIPFVELGKGKFCLPDPFSFAESCWNQVRNFAFTKENEKKPGNALSNSFEDYLKNILFPQIAPKSFEKIPEVKNSTSSEDKRADFLIKLPNAYIILECKNSIMSSDTSAYFHPDGLADLWCRIHSASEQIAATVKARDLTNKPVIPLVMTFYDSLLSSQVFEVMTGQTNYCADLGLEIAPIVRSLHEFEHWLSDRSLCNWAELVLQKQNRDSPVKPDHKGHNYQHLNDVSLF